MTTTPKISIIEHARHEPEDQEAKALSIDVSPREKSSFVAVEKDQWKAMTTPSDIGDMMNAINGVEEPSYYRGPIDAMSNWMIIDDPTFTDEGMSAIELPYVPDLNEDLLKNIPRLADNIKPIIEKYEALLKTYDELLFNARESLKYPMSISEIDQLQREIEIIKYNKGALINNYEEAQAVYEVQKAREEAAEAVDEP